MKNCATLRWENSSRKARCLSGLLRPLILFTVAHASPHITLSRPLSLSFSLPHFSSPPPPSLPSPSSSVPPKKGKKRKKTKKNTRGKTVRPRSSPLTLSFLFFSQCLVFLSEGGIYHHFVDPRSCGERCLRGRCALTWKRQTHVHGHMTGPGQDRTSPPTHAQITPCHEKYSRKKR